MNDRRYPVNPIEEKRRLEREALNERCDMTLADVAPLAFESMKGGLKDEGNAGCWYSTLKLYVSPSLGKTKVEYIHQRDIERALKPIWHSKAPTAKKARNRLGLVLKHAAAIGLEVNSNAVPNARQLLGDQRHKAKHHPAMHWQDVRQPYQWLDPRTTSQRAMMLYILIGGGARLGTIKRLGRSSSQMGVAYQR